MKQLSLQKGKVKWLLTKCHRVHLKKHGCKAKQVLHWEKLSVPSPALLSMWKYYPTLIEAARIEVSMLVALARLAATSCFSFSSPSGFFFLEQLAEFTTWFSYNEEATRMFWNTIPHILRTFFSPVKIVFFLGRLCSWDFSIKIWAIQHFC